MYFRKWQPSKTKIREFAKKMDEIDNFCNENGIIQSRSSDSYYFFLNGQEYRVSNHTVYQSNRKAINCFGERVREEYHPNGEEDGVVYITASKTRIIEIYNNLKAGKKLDRRGNIIRELEDKGIER